MTFSAYISDQNIFFEMTKFPPDSMQCTTISLIKLQQSRGAVDFLRNLGAFRWENRILVSILRLPIHYQNKKACFM